MKRRPDVRLFYEGRPADQSVYAAPFAASLVLQETVNAADGDAIDNRLIHGDNLSALAALAHKYEGHIDLIYVDPPFATDAHFGAFDDRWIDRASYLAMIEPRLRLLRTLLSPSGSLIVHLDWHAGHLVRCILGDLFGEENSLGEIIWAYGSPSGGRAAGKKLVKSHDVLYWFAKERGQHRFVAQRLPYAERYVKDWFRYVDEEGRRYRKRWRAKGKVERQYLDASPGMPLSTVWSDIQQVYADPRAYRAGCRSDITGYPTQKPIALLERIVSLTTDSSSFVLDAFCGSGTTIVAAAKKGRKFIGIDASPEAIAITAGRLRELSDPAPAFEIWSTA